METVVQKAEFRFRQNKETKWTRPTLEVDVPLPTANAIIEILERPRTADDREDKTKAMVVDAVHGLILNYLRGKVNDNIEFSQDDVTPLVENGELTLDFIANLARSQRNTITNSDLSEFGQAFVAVAAEVENDPELRIASVAGAETAAAAFADRLRAAAGKNEILDKLQIMIEKFCNAAADEVVEEHKATIEWLYVKLEEAKKKEELSLDNLD